MSRLALPLVSFCTVVASQLLPVWDGSRPGAVHASAAQETTRAADARLEDAYRLNNLGVAQLEQYDYEAAAATFAKALERVPTLQLARVNLAIALFHAGKLAEAELAAGQARDANPALPQPHYVIGLVAREDNRPEDATKAFERVLSLDPDDLGTRINLGQLYVRQQRFEEAVTLLRGAVDAEPYNVTAAYNFSVALTRAGKTEEADRAVERFQALRASGYATTFSNNYLERGRYAEALASRGNEGDLVDRTTPAVRFAAAEVAAAPGAAPPPGSPRGALTLADVDGDGDLDLVVAGPEGTSLFTNDGKAFARTPNAPSWPASSAVVVADYDNDLVPDIALAGGAGLVLLRQTSPGRFETVSPAPGLAGAPAAKALAFVDVDHDGDVDLLAAGIEGSGPGDSGPGDGGSGPRSSVRLYRNNGNGAFADVTREAGLEASARELAIVPSDVDNRRDVDLLFVASDAKPRLARNLRDGTFGEFAGHAGLSMTPGGTAVAAGDVNKDGFTDFVIAASAGSRIEMSDGKGRYTQQAAPAGTGEAVAVQLIDYDNDGVLDLAAVTPGGLRVWRHVADQWQDVTAQSVADELRPGQDRPDAFEAATAGDVDRDGDTDLVLRTRSGRVWLARNEGGNRRPSLSLRLTGRVSNRSGAGSNVEMRAGSLWQKLERTATSPATVPADLVFGLGGRERADVVRVLWPSGVLQAETVEGPAGAAARLDITELDRKPSSCPFLYTWNGTRFEFLSDFLGGGEMGYLHAPGIRNVPDPDEYMRIPGRSLVPRDGRLELRITNELEETTFIDRLQLLAITHPADVEVFPAEGLKSPPFAPFGLYVAPGLRPLARALDARGNDVLQALQHVDRRYADGFAVESIRGYAKPHALTLDLGEPAEPENSGLRHSAEALCHCSRADSSCTALQGCATARTLLVLTGWTDYAFSSDNVAAHQAGLALVPPSLEVKDEHGRWQTVIDEIGIPVGRPQSVVVDLTGKFLSASREVRIVTTMRIYWDQALVDTSGRARFLTGGELERGEGTALGITVTRMEPTSASLRWRGFSAEVSPDGREPFSYDYDRVTETTPWKLMPGRYTREGDVRELLEQVDDMFVVSRTGDELQVSFDATGVPPVREGLVANLPALRARLQQGDGHQLRQPGPGGAAAVPGHVRLSRRRARAVPDTPAHRAYVDAYNTRVVGRVVPPLTSGAASEESACVRGSAFPLPSPPSRGVSALSLTGHRALWAVCLRPSRRGALRAPTPVKHRVRRARPRSTEGRQPVGGRPWAAGKCPVITNC